MTRAQEDYAARMREHLTPSTGVAHSAEDRRRRIARQYRDACIASLRVRLATDRRLIQQFEAAHVRREACGA